MIAIGVDIGGTFIKVGLVNEKGKVIDRGKIETIKDNPKTCLENVSKVILELIKKNKVKVSGVGIGMPGLLNNGTLIESSNLKPWLGTNIASVINKNTHIKVAISNDANVAALGEATFGAAKSANNVILLTLGTGIGGGIIINKKIYDGNKGQGAELGHVVISLDGEKCGCGRNGCLETFASARALIRQAIKEMELNKKSYMWKLVDNNLDNVDASTPFKAEKHSDKSAKKVIDNYVKYLSQGILNYCNIFRPEIVLLSGGVALQKANLTNKVNKYLKDHYYGLKGAEKVIVKTSTLGYDTGVIGAACLILLK